MSPIQLAAIAFAGAIGAMFRGYTMDKLRPMLPAEFPWTTIVVNIVACYFIGLIMGHDFVPEFQKVACAGFLGGFSTMSTLNDDALSLLRNKKLVRFLAYMSITYVSCLLGCYIGIATF